MSFPRPKPIQARACFQGRAWLMAALALVAMLGAGCGRQGREAARDKIRQSGHSFNVDDFTKAAAAGDAPLIEAYLRGGIDFNAFDSHGSTALMAAAANGKADVVRKLLDDNAKPDLVNKDGDSALILAAAANQHEAVRVLVEANADVRLRGKDKLPALVRAIRGGYDQVVDVLLSTSRDQLKRDGQLDRALCEAAVLGNTNILKQLLDRGTNVNAASDNRETALMWAAEFGKKDAVALLLERGADPRLVRADGSNASVLALQRGFPDVAKEIDAKLFGAGGRPAAASPGATPANPAATSAAAGSPPPLDANEAAGVAMEKTFLKEKGIAPGTAVNTDTGQDDDHDGFSNDEERAAGTDPNDPKSHPPYYVKLHLVRIEGGTFPITFEGLADKSGKVQLSVHDPAKGDNDTGQRVELEPGGRVPGTPYRVDKVRPRSIYEKDSGRKEDVSELTLVDTETGRRTVLVKGMVSNNADAHAVLRFAVDGSEYTVKQGEQFSLSREPATHYQVLDLRPTQVVLKVVGTSQSVTIEK